MLKCETPNVVATRFPVDQFDFEIENENKHIIHLLEKSTCLKNCYAGQNYFFVTFEMKTFSEHPFGRMLRTPVPSQHVKDEMHKLQVNQ